MKKIYKVEAICEGNTVWYAVYKKTDRYVGDSKWMYFRADLVTGLYRKALIEEGCELYGLEP